MTAAWYITTETTSEMKKGGYVQGTVLLILRKRQGDEAGYKDEIVEDVRDEVARQIETMVGLNQRLEGHGRIENLFEDVDLQMAGYAAALRVLTGYSRIDGIDMTRGSHPTAGERASAVWSGRSSTSPCRSPMSILCQTGYRRRCGKGSRAPSAST